MLTINKIDFDDNRYYRGAACAVICFDSRRKQTADNVKNWVKELQLHADEDILIAINCTKCDLFRETPEWRTFIKNYVKDANRLSGSATDQTITSLVMDKTSPTSSSISSAITQLSNGSSSGFSSPRNTETLASPTSETENTEFAYGGIFNDARHPFFDMIQYARSINALYFETSSKDNEGIDDMFLTIGRKLIELTKRRRNISTHSRSQSGKSSSIYLIAIVTLRTF